MENVVSKKMNRFVYRGTCVYFYLFLLYSLVGRIIPVFYFVGDKLNQYMYWALAGYGMLLIVADFIGERIVFRARYIKVLYCFVGIMIISSFINIKFGYIENIKTVVWTLIQISVFYPFYLRLSKEDMERVLKRSFILISFIWNIAVLVSLIQFVMKDTYYYSYYLNGVVGMRYQGIQEGRLYGIFNDPNFAGVTSAYVIFMLFFIIIKSRRRWQKTMVCFSLIILNFIYLLLCGSRTALLAFAGGLFVSLFLILKNKYKNKKGILIFSAAVSFMLVMAILAGGKVLKKGLAYLPSIYEEHISEGKGHSAKGELLVSLLRGREDIKVYWNYEYEREIIQSNEKQEQTVEEEKSASQSENSLDKTAVKRENTQEKLVNRTDVNKENITNNRITIWADYLKSMKGRYLIGTSPRNMMQYLDERNLSEYVVERGYETHNGFLSLFVGCGIIGTSVIIVFIVLVSKRIFIYCFKEKEICKEFVLIFSILVVILIYTCAFTELFFVNNLTTIIFWTLLGSLWCWLDNGKQAV